MVNKVYSLFKGNPSSKTHLVFLYRILSLVLTSIFYLLGPQFPLIFKVVVVISLAFSAWIITDLLKRYGGNHNILKLIVLTETIGLTLFLVPTGGISSPFILYALNPVLVAASFLTPLFCWTALTFYLGSATLIAFHFFQVDSFTQILQNNSYFYLVCLLTTLLAQLFSGLTTELGSKATALKEQQDELVTINQKLTETNAKYEVTLDHIMSLYYLMDNFSSKNDLEKLANEITTSLLKFTKSDAAFVWLTDRTHENSYIASANCTVDIEMNLIQKWESNRGKKEPFTRKMNDALYWMKTIRTSKSIGLLGVKVSSPTEDNMTFLVKRTFEFMANLSEIMLERIHLDEVMDQMIVIEEQNRIANEIHDSVSQRLFGIVYSLHSLQATSKNMTIEQLNEEFHFLSQSANTTIKELRSAIYRLSSVKNGEKPFLARLEKYLDEFAKLNGIEVDYEITIEENFMSDELKQALYRIIFEACGNAVRHGRCSKICLHLSSVDEKIELWIQDDGIGFTLDDKTIHKVKGIGLLNMQNLTHSFDGTFSIKSVDGPGTVIQIVFPNSRLQKKKEVVGS